MMFARLIRRTVALGGFLTTTAVVARRIDRRWAATEDPSRPEDYVVPEGESQVVTTDDGAELAVTIAGEGPTVVLSHCWTGTREAWAPVAHRLVRSGCTVVLYDQRGHGSSTLGSEGCTIARLGADLAAVLEQLDIKDAILAGHSMGSMTVLSLAAHHREVIVERAAGLVLVSTAANGLGFGPLDKVLQGIIGSSLVDPILRSPVGPALMRGTVGRRASRRHLVLTRDMFVACPPSVRAAFLSAMQSMDLRADLRGLDLPTTIVSGSLDGLTPPWLARQVRTCITGSTIVTVSGAGHMLVLEVPDRIAGVITAAVTSGEPVIHLT